MTAVLLFQKIELIQTTWTNRCPIVPTTHYLFTTSFKWQLYYCAKKTQIHSNHSSEYLLCCSTIDKFKPVQTVQTCSTETQTHHASSILIGRPTFCLQAPNDYHSKLITGRLFSNGWIIHHPLQMTPGLLFPKLINYSSHPFLNDHGPIVSSHSNEHLLYCFIIYKSKHVQTKWKSLGGNTKKLSGKLSFYYKVIFVLSYILLIYFLKLRCV